MNNEARVWHLLHQENGVERLPGEGRGVAQHQPDEAAAAGVSPKKF